MDLTSPELPCLACQTLAGAIAVPGGLIFETEQQARLQQGSPDIERMAEAAEKIRKVLPTYC